MTSQHSQGMKQGKRVKPVYPIEYRLLVTPRYNEREEQYVTLIGLRTMNEFSSFRYEIIVESELIGTTLRLDIRGLRAPQVSIPGSGPAVFKKEFPNLFGLCTIIVEKPGKETDSFKLNISKNSVVVEKNPKASYVHLVTTEEEW